VLQHNIGSTREAMASSVKKVCGDVVNASLGQTRNQAGGRGTKVANPDGGIRAD